MSNPFSPGAQAPDSHPFPGVNLFLGCHLSFGFLFSTAENLPYLLEKAPYRISPAIATARSNSSSKGKATKPDQDGGQTSACYRILFTLSVKAMSIHKVWRSLVFPPARQIFLLGNALDRQFLYPRCNITSASHASIARCLSSFRGVNFQDVSILLYIKISSL